MVAHCHTFLELHIYHVYYWKYKLDWIQCQSKNVLLFQTKCWIHIWSRICKTHRQFLRQQDGNNVVKFRLYVTHWGQHSLKVATGDQSGELSFERKSANLRGREVLQLIANSKTLGQLSSGVHQQCQEVEVAHDEPRLYWWMTLSHITWMCSHF